MNFGVALLVNHLMDTGSYSATSNNMKSVHWLLMGGLFIVIIIIVEFLVRSLQKWPMVHDNSS